MSRALRIALIVAVIVIVAGYALSRRGAVQESAVQSVGVPTTAAPASSGDVTSSSSMAPLPDEAPAKTGPKAGGAAGTPGAK